MEMRLCRTTTKCLCRLGDWQPPALQIYDIVTRLAEAAERRITAMAKRKVRLVTVRVRPSRGGTVVPKMS